MRTQTKIALIFFVVFLAITLLLGASVYYFSTQYSFTDFYARLKLRAVVASKSVLDRESTKTKAFKEMRDLYLEKLPQEKDYFFKSEPGKSFEKELAALGLPSDFLNHIAARGNATYKNGNTFFSGIVYKSVKGNYIVIVSANNYFNTHHLAYLRSLLFVAIPLASLLALFISVVFARKVFGPVKQITDQVKDISAQSMDLRLPVVESKDEISELAVTFNHMLDRLETAFETQNNFISNASHELSTPLTAIIGETEVTLSKPRQPEEYAASLSVILNEAERLENIIKSLLFLAQTGFEGKAQKMEPLRMDELLWDVKATMDKINPENQIYIDLGLMPENPEMLKISGNAQLLHLALSNIVSNACKYSGNKAVKVAIGTSDDHIVLVVKDTGIGIPEAELKFIYDPFFRASNTKNFKGYGIGLPLARNIIRLHKGSIQVSAQVNEGTTVRLNLPLDKHAVPRKA